MGVHHIVSVGLHVGHLGVEHRGALLAAVSRPQVVGTDAHPRTDGEVETAAHSRRLLIAALGVDILIPNAVSPRHSALSEDAPGVGAQFTVLVAWRFCRPLGLVLRLGAKGGEHAEQQHAEPNSCPIATE